MYARLRLAQTDDLLQKNPQTISNKKLNADYKVNTFKEPNKGSAVWCFCILKVLENHIAFKEQTH